MPLRQAPPPAPTESCSGLSAGQGLLRIVSNQSLCFSLVEFVRAHVLILLYPGQAPRSIAAFLGIFQTMFELFGLCLNSTQLRRTIQQSRIPGIILHPIEPRPLCHAAVNVGRKLPEQPHIRCPHLRAVGYNGMKELRISLLYYTPPAVCGQ